MAFSNGLMAVLGRSWGDLGLIWGGLGGRGMGFRLGETAVREEQYFRKIRSQDASLAHLERIWVAKGGQNEGRGGSEEELS